MFFTVPGYQITEKLSENASYQVYRGIRSQDHAPVLLKVLDQPHPSSRTLALLRHEYEITRWLDLNGVEKTYALEDFDKGWMIVVEDFGGLPLSEQEVAGSMQPEEFLNLAVQMVDTLAGMHARQVIHKNITPANIFYNPSTHQARLVNFGGASWVLKERVPLQSPYKLLDVLPYIPPEMTGWMNRIVDYRSDFYLLGATLYELLTGAPPFQGESPLELVHAHLAVMPDPPDSKLEQWNACPLAFQMISDILLKLLAKNPEERYQTHAAIRSDFQQVLEVIQAPSSGKAMAASFIAGQGDCPVNLNISQMVIGREQETDVLLQAFYRTLNGPAEMVLVSGEVGVGKTSLINQLIGPLAERMGLFLYAKFDQVRQQEPYQSLTQVLEEFCHLIFSEPVSAFGEWRKRVGAAVEPYGQLLVELCPQLEKLIGPQPPVEQVNESEFRFQLNLAVIRFLEAVCRPEHPVVIFLDDLQWMGPDSSLLWHDVFLNATLQNLLAVGAYREKKLASDHPILKLGNEQTVIPWRVTQLQLHNLDCTQVSQIVASALATKTEEVTELADLVCQITGGNPYFTKEFLSCLHDERLLAFDLAEQRWRWDIQAIKEYASSDEADSAGIVELFIDKILNMPEETQIMLQYAALIGKRFDTATLLFVLGEDKAEMLAISLMEGIRAELIYPLDENTYFLAGKTRYSHRKGDVFPVTDAAGLAGVEEFPSLVDLLEEHVLFEFQHDRVQQAVITMLGEKQVQEISLQMGWLLLKKAEQMGQQTLQDKIYKIVDYLNAGNALITVPSEKIHLARLNLIASSQARLRAAFEAAFHYLTVARQLLPVDGWESQYDLTLECVAAGAEVALLIEDLSTADALALEAEIHAHTLLEKARVYRTRMEIYVLKNQLDRVVELGIESIQLLGFDLEIKDPQVVDLDPKVINIEADSQFVSLPAMTDPLALTVAGFSEALISAAFVRDDPRFIHIVLFYIALYSRYGNPPGASFVYIAYGEFLISHFEMIELGCQIGEKALELAEKSGSPRAFYSARFIYYAYIHHWLGSAREGASLLYENIKPVFEAGNLRSSFNSQDVSIQNSFMVGFALDQVRSRQDKALRQSELFRLSDFSRRLKVWAQVVIKLRDVSSEPQELAGELFGVDEVQKLKESNQNLNQVLNLHVAQAFLSLLFREPRRALEAATAAHALKLTAGSQLILDFHIFTYSLALLSAGLGTDDLSGRLEKVEENLKLMRSWADLVPENFVHQVELVEAELASCLGQAEQAAEGYEKGIWDARQNGYIHESALAAELAGEYYLAQGDKKAAREHLLTAYNFYQEWGAKTKLADLIRRYPEWLPLRREVEIREGLPVKSISHDELSLTIDFTAILKASLELSRETDLESLLSKLMRILVENAGAQHGVLVLVEGDRWILEILGSNKAKNTPLIVPLEFRAEEAGEAQVPVSIINYVINSRLDLVLEDASISQQFSQDVYVQRRRPRSILCAPLLNQGLLSGVVYLENNLTAGAFTKDRLEVVRLIAGQAAVSIEKARFYENLEMLVEKRTHELEEVNQKLREEIKERQRVEEALRLSEARYRTVFESTGTAMVVVDENGYITLANEEFVRLTGYSRRDLANKFDALKVVAPPDLERVRKIRTTRLIDPSQVPYNYEIRLMDSSGLEKIALNTAAVLPGSQSTVVSLIDISQMKQYELALQKSEALYRAVVNMQAEMVCRYLPDLTLTFVNQTFCEFMGKTADQLIGQSFLTSMLREGHRHMQNAVRGMVEHPGETELDHAVVTTQGELRWQRWLHRPIVENGEVVEFQAVGFDITAQKAAEDSLRYNEALLRRVLEILPVGVWVMDNTPQIILGNPESQRIWADARYVEMQSGGQYFAWRVDTGAWIRSEAWSGKLAIAQGKTTLSEELEIETFFGERRTILNSAIPLLIEGVGQVGAIVVNQDITKRKQDEEELQRAHDQLSTLLNISQSIVSTLELDSLLNLIIEQLGVVLPYDAAVILILEQDFLEFRVIRGPSFLHEFSKYKIPANEPILIEPFIKEREPYYIPDLRNSNDLSNLIQRAIKFSLGELTTLRTWLAHPLIAKEGFVGIMVLAHTQPDFYSPQVRILSQAYANQVAIAIHNAQLYERVRRTATLEERNRLARELHDSVAQALYGISLFTDATHRALETGKLDVARQHLVDLELLSKDAMSDMRLLIFELRPPILEKVGLVSALQSRLDSVERRTGINTIFQTEGEFHFSDELEGELYRIAQEALNNVIKHAQADRVEVWLTAEAGNLQMVIADNGIGFDLASVEQAGGQGLRNIRERSEHLGAACRIESTPDQGTRVSIEVKL